jgi:N4-gp56 family major capsid protein
VTEPSYYNLIDERNAAMAYQPASVLTSTSGLTHLAAIYYDRVAVENLKPNLPFVAVTSRRKLPDRNGRTIQLFGYDLMPDDTTPGQEGAVGTGIAPTTSIRQVTVNQYFNFSSFSDILVETAIDPIVENTAAEMGFKAALTSNSLARMEFEAQAASDPYTVLRAGDPAETLSASLVRMGVFRLRSLDVRPQADGLFAGIVHPLAAFDLMNDNVAGGVIDILKFHKEGAEELMRGVQGYRVIDISGVRFIETTTATMWTNQTVGTTTGLTLFGTYIIGQDAVFSVSLGATEIPEQRNFQLIVRNWEPSAADPARVIGASCAYNFKYAALRVPQAIGLHPRFMVLQLPSSIA